MHSYENILKPILSRYLTHFYQSANHSKIGSRIFSSITYFISLHILFVCFFSFTKSNRKRLNKKKRNSARKWTENKKKKPKQNTYTNKCCLTYTIQKKEEWEKKLKKEWQLLWFNMRFNIITVADVLSDYHYRYFHP